MVIRFRLLIIILFIAYATLLFHLYDFHIVKGKQYLARSISQYLASGFINSERGIIYFTDKGNNPLPAALNKDFPIVYAVPKLIADAKEAANTLSAIFNIPVDDLEKAFSNKENAYKVLAKKAGAEIVKKINALDMKGVVVDSEPARFYPSGKIASHLLGFVGPTKNSVTENGHYGVEEFYNSVLSPKSDPSSDAQSPQGEAGADLSLTIDLGIQIESEKILSGLMETYKAAEGTILIADPGTGKILAMASAPNFDINEYQKYPLATFINPATQHTYEPGSVFKVLTMAAGIDAGKITPQTTYIDTGQLKISGRTIQNFDFKTFGPHGKLTMTNVVEQSLNTGAVFVEQQLGRDAFLRYLKKFGVDEKTGIDLPAEEKGSLRRLNPKEQDIAFATASYGQGVSVTPIELLSAVSAIANGGNLMRPYVNAALEPKLIRRVVTEKTARDVAGMMISAVNKAEVGKVNGYNIAGKSGTAYVPDFKKGGYTNDVVNTYVGFGPVSNPKFIILVKLDKPIGAPLAGVSVVPAFRNLAQFIINYYSLPPDAL